MSKPDTPERLSADALAGEIHKLVSLKTRWQMFRAGFDEQAVVPALSRDTYDPDNLSRRHLMAQSTLWGTTGLLLSALFVPGVTLPTVFLAGMAAFAAAETAKHELVAGHTVFSRWADDKRDTIRQDLRDMRDALEKALPEDASDADFLAALRRGVIPLNGPAAALFLTGKIKERAAQDRFAKRYPEWSDNAAPRRRRHVSADPGP